MGIVQLHNLKLRIGFFFIEGSFLNNREQLRVEERLLQQKQEKQIFSTSERPIFHTSCQCGTHLKVNPLSHERITKWQNI